MLVLNSFFVALMKLLWLFFFIYGWIVVARAFISWVNPDPYNPVVRFLVKATEPVLSRIRRVLPPLGGIDWSPMALLFALFFGQELLRQLMRLIPY